MKIVAACIVGWIWISLVSSFDIDNFEKNIDVYLPKLQSEEDFQNFALELDEAVEVIANSRNGTSRNFWEDKVVKVISAFFVKALEYLECQACQLGIKAVHKITQWDWTEEPIISVIDFMCRKAQKKPASVCKGVAHSSGSTLFKVLRYIDSGNPIVPSMACYAIGNVCPMPSVPIKQLSLPEKVNNKKTLNKNQSYRYILHISDLHYDREYKQGAEASCAKPICCQADSNSDEKYPNIIRKPASKWGEYNCDANKLMLDSLLNKAAQVHQNQIFDMVLFTGDLPAHDMWKEEIIRSETTEAEAFRLISDHFSPKSNHLYPVIGNHESVPLNQFPFQGKLDGKNFHLYNFVADQWKSWLPEQSLASVRNGGFYSIQHSKDLKVLVLNTNLHYTYNFYALIDPSSTDPNGMFAWMIEELQDAENKGSRVYITSHIPPGSTDFYRHWSDSYHRIIERYAHIISGQFYGHLHTDEFEVFYSSTNKNSQTAISAGYLAPSMSTMNGINPSFRVYKVDANTYEVVDYTQYYADLKKQSTWKNDAEWEIMYTARQAYGFGSNTTSFPTLNGAFWHRATEFMEKSSDNFNQFYNLLNGRGEQPKTCDKECQQRMICTLRAGKSRDNCAIVVPFS